MKKQLLSLLLALTIVLCGCATASDTPVPSSSAAAEVTQPSTPSDLKTIALNGGTVTALSGADRLCAVMEAASDGTGILTALDSSSAAVLGQAHLPSPYYDFVTYPGGVAAFTWEENTLQVYSESMELLWSRTLPESESGTLQTDGCFYIFSPEHRITQLNLADQSEQEIAISSELDAVDVLVCRDGRSLLRCSSGLSDLFMDYWIDWSTGALLPAEHTSSELPLNRYQYYLSVFGSDGTYLSFPGNEVLYLIPSHQPWVICSDETSALLAESGSTLVYADLTDKSVRRRSTGGVSSAVICGRHVVYSDSKHPDSVLIWDTEATEVAENTVQALTFTDIAAEDESILSSIEADTGIKIFIGEDTLSYNDIWPTSYLSDAITDPLCAHLGLLEVSRLIREYPDGIFQQMQPDADSPIQLYLTGSIRGIEQSSGLSSVAGFMVNLGGKPVIVLDISTPSTGDALRATLVHELMHVMEQRILQHGSENGLDYFGYWISFLPDPSLYYYSYHNENGTEITDNAYTAWSDTPMEDVLFLDSYCRTMPSEDIARMMEHLYLGEKSPFAQQLQTGVIAQKAKYLCAVIRNCFSSCQIDDKLPWESLVDPVPFSEYEDAVRNHVSKPLG